MLVLPFKVFFGGVAIGILLFGLSIVLLMNGGQDREQCPYFPSPKLNSPSSPSSVGHQWFPVVTSIKHSWCNFP